MALRDLPKTPMEQIQGLLGPYISAIPVLGTVDAITRAGRAAVSGNGAGAAGALADVIPVGRGVSRAVKAITKGKSAGDVGGLLNIRAPQQDALDLAQKRAALPISEGGLGLPPDNTPMQRAKAGGYITPAYRGTTADESQLKDRTFASDNVDVANSYAGYLKDFADDPVMLEAMQKLTPNGNVMPLLVRDVGAAKARTNVPDYEMILDRNQARSRFAAFDPFRFGENDLLAIQSGSGSSGLDSSNLNRYETEADRRMEIARRNAALPVEQGGLGLPENNTPMDRAKAMGYVDRVYHGTDKDFGAFDPAMSRQDVQYMPGIFTADDPDMSSAYGDRILPLLQKRGTTVMDKREARRSGAEIPTVDTIYDKQKGIRVTTDPTNLRSVFAAFDPMRRNEADLLAFRGNIGTSNLLNINPLLGLLENP